LSVAKKRKQSIVVVEAHECHHARVPNPLVLIVIGPEHFSDGVGHSFIANLAYGDERVIHDIGRFIESKTEQVIERWDVGGITKNLCNLGSRLGILIPCVRKHSLHCSIANIKSSVNDA
tara:strand:- start:99 stop:455 length:357 start_codon:yes stop_codon:yes gene_type:complete